MAAEAMEDTGAAITEAGMEDRATVIGIADGDGVVVGMEDMEGMEDIILTIIHTQVHTITTIIHLPIIIPPIMIITILMIVRIIIMIQFHRLDFL